MSVLGVLPIVLAIAWPGAAAAAGGYPGRPEIWSLVLSLAITGLLYWWIASARRQQTAERMAKVVRFPVLAPPRSSSSATSPRR